MDRLSIGLCAGLCSILLLAAGCGSVPSGSPGSSQIPGASVGGAVLTDLCDANNTSGLTRVADELDELDASTTDVTDLQLALDEVSSNLGNLETDATTLTLSNAAGAAIQVLQGVLDDPAAREQAAAQASQALRTLESAICP